jgi:hypothetical protein
LLLPPGMEHAAHPHSHAHPYHLRGDFLVHCHVEMHMMQGLAALLRSQQTVYLTAKEAHDLANLIGLALDPGDNACPAVDKSLRTSVGAAGKSCPVCHRSRSCTLCCCPTHRASRYWGYGPRADQARM